MRIWVQSDVGVIPVCGDLICSAAEAWACPQDCIQLQNCPSPLAGGRVCSGHGACNFLEGNCLCFLGYVGDACESCDHQRGFFLTEAGHGGQYCRRVHGAATASPVYSIDTDERSKSWKLSIPVIVLLTAGCVVVLGVGSSCLWRRHSSGQVYWVQNAMGGWRSRASTFISTSEPISHEVIRIE
jgi:hypothetical protein